MFSSTDGTSIPVGSQWLDEIIDAIKASSMHLVLCSPESITRAWIQYEAGAARLQGVPTVPLCHSGLSPAQLPVPISLSQGITLSDAGEIRDLYGVIAKMIGSSVPAVDFEKYAAEIKDFERRYEMERQATHSLADDVARGPTIEDRVQDPRVLCVTSEQFAKLGFANQIDLVLKAFPQRLHHDRIRTSVALRQILTTEKVDVVHIAGYVCPRTGDLYFSDVNVNDGEPATPDPDIVTADALADLLKMAKTRLVVIGSCESLVLAATLVAVANVIGTRDMIGAKTMAKWVETFYGTLESQPLSVAFEFAVKASGAAMRLYARNEVIMVRSTATPVTQA